MSETVRHLPVAEAYDRWATSYDSYDNPMLFGADHALTQHVEAAKGKCIVELGCGTGRNLARFAQHGANKLVGCDLSPGMLQQARNRALDCTLLEHDMAHPLPLEAASADLVLFSLTLEHVSELVAPFTEARRLLRDDGSIVVIEIHPFLALGHVGAHFRDGDAIVEMPTVPHAFEDYVSSAVSAGLRITGCREWRPRDFPAPVPPKVLKRGPDTPLVVELTLGR